jgi:rsbT co-antagonist protein RsbR
MNPDMQRFARFWREQGDAPTEQLCDDLATHAGPAYAQLPRDTLFASVHNGVLIWQALFETGDTEPMIKRAQGIGTQRTTTQVDIDQVMRTSDIFREHIWRLLRQFYGDGGCDLEMIEQIEEWLHMQRNAIFSVYGRTLEDAWRDLAAREQALASQQLLIQELSAPILPIAQGVLLLPLVGSIDPRRATQIMELALEQIVAQQADVLILDITGVPLVDTSVANHLLQMTRAVNLLGAQVVLVGMSPEVAQTIVQLGVDLRDIITLANLQAGIFYVLGRQGIATGLAIAT